MARAGLGSDWKCIFANDFDPKKGLTYQANWGTRGELHVGDVKLIKASDIPGVADLVWGSFPCQDLSLAGAGAGLKGQRSGSFYSFWNVMKDLIARRRTPKIIALENVCGTLTSHDGNDFRIICEVFVNAGYKVGALVINADLFVPQSRPRLFIIGVRNGWRIDHNLVSPGPIAPFHTSRLQSAVEKLPPRIKSNFLWWNIPTPAHRNSTFANIIEENPSGVTWHSSSETKQLLGLMSDLNLAKVAAAKRAGRLMVGGIYKRTRVDNGGNKMQRAEVRFDDVAGCLRTPVGGSSRQTIILIDGPTVRSRLISSRETARLMGLDDSYKLPKKYNEAYHLTGDGVVVPVVRHLAQHIFEPVLLKQNDRASVA